MSTPILKVEHLTVTFGTQKTLDDLSFEVQKGETLAIIGPNGAGKTILFKSLLGLIPYTGSINWLPGTKIGYVPQRLFVSSDLPLTVREFFSLKNTPQAEIHKHLESVGFTDKQNLLLKTKLGNLSGGQLQRILIAWALAKHPDILLFDEPTTGIDISAEGSIYQLLHDLQTQNQLTLILISHELQVVYRYATNVLCLNKEGLCYGPPHQTLTESALKGLFGESASIYHHQHQV